MQIHVSSRVAVDSLIASLEGNIATIAVTDPNSPLTCIGQPYRILRLQFHDLDCIWPQLNEVVYFDTGMAREVVQFVKEHIDTVDHLVIHCEAGISRSTAIAAAISEHIGKHHSYFSLYPCMNTMVFSILRVAFGFGSEPLTNL